MPSVCKVITFYVDIFDTQFASFWLTFYSTRKKKLLKLFALHFTVENATIQFTLCIPILLL